MIILLTVILAMVCTIFTMLAVKKYSELQKSKEGSEEKLSSKGYDWYSGIATISGVIAIFGVVLTILMIAEVSTEHVLDKKIEMYQQENYKIEKNIDVAVSGFMNQEQNIFDNFELEENSIFLCSNIPELKSDALVQKQIETYISNNDSIKELKTEKIEILKSKWYLYFSK